MLVNAKHNQLIAMSNTERCTFYFEMLRNGILSFLVFNCPFVLLDELIFSRVNYSDLPKIWRKYSMFHSFGLITPSFLLIGLKGLELMQMV